MVCAIPKYTQYQLSHLVEQKLDKMDLTIQLAPHYFPVDKELLQEILEKQVRFKTKHYKAVSLITGLSVEDLLEDEVIKPISFRSDHDKSDPNAVDKIETISDFFKEIALLKKLSGQIRVSGRGIL